MGLAISLPSRVYARIGPRSGLAPKKFIDVGVGVVDNDYRGEPGVVLYNHSEGDFQVNERNRMAQMILERMNTPIVQKVQALDQTKRGVEGFRSAGMQSQGQSKLDKRGKCNGFHLCTRTNEPTGEDLCAR